MSPGQGTELWLGQLEVEGVGNRSRCTGERKIRIASRALPSLKGDMYQTLNESEQSGIRGHPGHKHPKAVEVSHADFMPKEGLSIPVTLG